MLLNYKLKFKKVQQGSFENTQPLLIVKNKWDLQLES